MFLPDYQTRVIDRLFDSPDLFVPMFDDEKEAALIVPMTRKSYSQTVFLDWRTVRAAPAAELVPIKSIERALREQNLSQRPLRFIFHSAFAGSTLMCRFLDHPGKCLPYKEPFILNQVCMDRRDSMVSGGPVDQTVNLDLVLALLGRSYARNEQVVIKPTDSCINIARELLTYRPEYTGIILYLPLDEFVVASLKRPDRREFLKNNVPRTRVDLVAMDLLPDVDVDRLSEGEAAAFVWLGLMVYYLDLLGDTDLRVRSLDAATFYRDPSGTLTALIDFFDLPLTASDIEDAIDQNLFARDSKDPSVRYDASSKAAEDAQLHARLSREFDDARAWLDRHAAGMQIPERLPRSLA